MPRLVACVLFVGMLVAMGGGRDEPPQGGGAAARQSDDAIRERERQAEPLYKAALAAATASQADRGKALDAIEAALKAGACPTRTLSEEAFGPLHTQQRFRELIRDHARLSSIVMVTPREEGEPLRVSGVVRDADGKPVEGALVFVYHTDAKGYYSPGGMEEANPRLFGYIRTDKDGQYAYRTIRPGHYPVTFTNERIEQHIHYEVTAPGFDKVTTRLGFADDPHWAREGRTPPRWAVPVEKNEKGEAVCALDVRLTRERPR